MIIGIGNDIVDVPRIIKILNSTKINNKFIHKILTKGEIEKIPFGRKASYTAKRFAIKEAIAKALGCGFGSALKFIDIEIANDDLGRPVATLNPKVLEKLNLADKKINIQISVADTKDYATATAIIECLDE